MTALVKLLTLFALITLASSVNNELKRINREKNICANPWFCNVATNTNGTSNQTGNSTNSQTGNSTNSQTGNSTNSQTGNSTNSQTGNSTNNQTGNSTNNQPANNSSNSGTTHSGGNTTPSDGDNVNAPAKPVFPLTVREVFGIILLVVIAGLANSGGVGGGPLLSSILMIFFQYTPNVSSQVVYTLVFGGSLGNFLNLVGRKNILTSKPLIDYDLSLLCMPPMVLGANIGILAERMTAPFLLISGILIVTSYSFYQILRNSIDLYKGETKRKVQIKQGEEERAAALSKENSITAPLIQKSENETDQEGTPAEVPTSAKGVNAEGHESVEVKSVASDEEFKNYKIGLVANWDDLTEDQKRFVRSETTLFPVQKYAILFALLLVVMATAFFKGTDEFPSYVGVEYCGGAYWTLFLASLVAPVIIFFVNMRILNNLVIKREKYSNIFKQHKFKLTRKIITKLNTASLIAGFLAGWLGIGGGMIMKPTLLSVGVATQTVSSTAGFFVLQTSLVTLFQALLYQDISTTDQAFFFVVSFIGSFMVSWFLNWSIKKTGRPSIILFALLFVLLISILATPIFEVYINLHHPSQLLQFGTFC